MSLRSALRRVSRSPIATVAIGAAAGYAASRYNVVGGVRSAIQETYTRTANAYEQSGIPSLFANLYNPPTIPQPPATYAPPPPPNAPSGILGDLYDRAPGTATEGTRGFMAKLKNWFSKGVFA